MSNNNKKWVRKKSFRMTPKKACKVQVIFSRLNYRRYYCYSLNYRKNFNLINYIIQTSAWPFCSPSFLAVKLKEQRIACPINNVRKRRKINQNENKIKTVPNIKRLHYKLKVICMRWKKNHQWSLCNNYKRKEGVKMTATCFMCNK